MNSNSVIIGQGEIYGIDSSINTEDNNEKQNNNNGNNQVSSKTYNNHVQTSKLPRTRTSNIILIMILL